MLVLSASLGLALALPATAAPSIGYRVVAEYPHDRSAFTQGLVFHAGGFYEGTGIEGRSTLRKVDLHSGRIVRMRRLPRDVFGEGISIVGDRVVQLTWRAGRGFVFALRDFSRLAEFRYAGEGWGVAYDGYRLVMSDGSATLRFLDAATFEPLGRVQVSDGGRPVRKLNELEFIQGSLFANVWQSARIARIALASGRVTGWLDLAPLAAEVRRADDAGVLNGIAYDANTRRVLVTGKRWPKVFALELLAQ